MRLYMCWSLVLVVFGVWLPGGAAVEVIGAGASFPSLVYQQWMASYKHLRQKSSNAIISMRYDAVGSGEGKARIKGQSDQAVHYAGSDIALTAQEMTEYPDLRTVPVIAGAIVIAYNVPEIEGLTLSLDVTVGIYNGSITYWNDPTLQALNPGRQLPNARIVVLARKDNSGTTETFTSALSSVSAEWRQSYGAFSQGFDSTLRQSHHWNESIVSYYGNGNSGVAELISAIYYSIGYVSIAAARTSSLSSATFLNSVGDAVNASTSSIQNAIRHANGSFNIINVAGPNAYPLAMFSYLIIPMSSVGQCEVATELVRYINWFLQSSEAEDAAEHLYLVPLDNDTSASIVNEVLQVITCQGQNVWQLLLEQIELENKIIDNQDLPVAIYIGIVVLSVIIIVLTLAFLRQQYKVHSELIKDAWKIQSARIEFYNFDSLQDVNTSLSVEGHAGSTNGNAMKALFGDEAWANEAIMFGKYSDYLVTLVKLTNNDMNLSIKNRKAILWMKYNVKHPNVLELLGLTEIHNQWYTANSGHMRGSLRDMVRDSKLRFQNNSQVAITKDIARAVAYLHKKGIVHGQLTSSCCFVDSNWQLKIASWCDQKLSRESINPSKNRVETLSYKFDDSHADKLYWTAPEILKYNREPEFPSDVYSMCMVFQEVFSGAGPYHELNVKPSEIVNAIVTCGITPRISDKTPTVIKCIMERAWNFDPGIRPTSSQIEHKVCKAYPKSASLLDCMKNSVEQYAATLEAKVTEHQLTIKSLEDHVTRYMYHNVPKPIAESLSEHKRFDTQYVEDVCIIACELADICQIIRHVTPNGIMNLLSYFYEGLDQCLLSDDVYRLSRDAQDSVYAAGVTLTGQNSQPMTSDTSVRVQDAVSIALKILTFTTKFSAERLVGIDTKLQIKVGISNGNALVGVLKTAMPQLVVLGNAVGEAQQLCQGASPGFVKASHDVATHMKDVKGIHRSTTVNGEFRR